MVAATQRYEMKVSKIDKNRILIWIFEMRFSGTLTKLIYS